MLKFKIWLESNQYSLEVLINDFSQFFRSSFVKEKSEIENTPATLVFQVLKSKKYGDTPESGILNDIAQDHGFQITPQTHHFSPNSEIYDGTNMTINSTIWPTAFRRLNQDQPEG